MRVGFFHHLSCLLGNRWFWGKEKTQGSIPHTYSHPPLFADKTLTVSLPLPPPRPLPQSHQWPRRQCCCGESRVSYFLSPIYFSCWKNTTLRARSRKKKLGRAPPISVTWSFIEVVVGWRKIRLLLAAFSHSHTYYALACNQRT